MIANIHSGTAGSFLIQTFGVAPPEQMQVNVVDFLPGLFTNVKNQPVTRVFNT